MAHQLPSVLIILNSFFSVFSAYCCCVGWKIIVEPFLLFFSCLGLSGANDETYWSLG